MTDQRMLYVILSKSSTDRRKAFRELLSTWFENTPTHKPSSQPFLVASSPRKPVRGRGIHRQTLLESVEPYHRRLPVSL